MSISKSLSGFRTRVCVLIAMLALMLGTGYSQSASQIANNRGNVLANSKDLGPEDSSKQITINVWLKQHSKDGFDILVTQMYQKGSPSYHHWITLDEYKVKHAPTAEEAARVGAFLASHDLRILSIEKNNHFVTAMGRVCDIQNAFNVQIKRFEMNGTVHMMNMSEPTISGPVGALVAGVQGLNDLNYVSNAKVAMNPDTGAPYKGVPLAEGVNPNGLFFTGNCFRNPRTVTFKTDGHDPSATYMGNRFGSNIVDPVPNLSPCGYDPAEMQSAYGMTGLYDKGLNGAGQTIVIVDAFGSNTILDDANEFSSLNGLPPLTSSNFQIFTPTGPVKCETDCLNGNWNLETTLDVEWAHSIAPGANIALVLARDNSFTNLDLANLFAIESQLGPVLSNSFGIPEIALVVFLPSELVVQNTISELAAALGISQNISTGDFGDFLAFDQANFGINDVSVQASSPFVTAIGGTSLFLNENETIKFQTGWGFNFTRIANPTPNPPTIPPLGFGFQGGSGGGTSIVFAKPAFQKDFPGDFRQVPDISMDADPNTGAEIIITPDSVPGHPMFVEVIGGTSLSCPMFSALWAITNEAAGGPLGQAAPFVYSLKAPAITDVTAVSSPFNVSGEIFDPPSPPTIETPDALAAPLENTKKYVSALFQSPTSTRWDVFTFGTDSSLTIGPGWDNVTGVGTPNGSAFVGQLVEHLP